MSENMSEAEHAYWEGMCEDHCHCGMAMADHTLSAGCNYAIPMTRPDTAPPRTRENPPTPDPERDDHE